MRTEPTILTTLVSRLRSDNARVCAVTCSLLERVVACWSEDAMLELVFRCVAAVFYLNGCKKKVYFFQKVFLFAVVFYLKNIDAMLELVFRCVAFGVRVE